MKFRFDIDKAIAAAAYVVDKAGGAYNVLPLVKVLYHANRTSLVRYGRSITGDRLISMDHGPNVSETYDLIDGSDHAKPEDLKRWREFFSKAKDDNSVKLIGNPNLDCLSGRELQLLDEGCKLLAGVRGRIDHWSHDYFPEWENPGKTSKTIDPKKILKLEHKSEDEIAQIEEEIAEVNWLLGYGQ